MHSPLYVTVFPVPMSVPVLVMQTEARGKRRIAEMRARRSAAVSHRVPSWGRYDMITPNASPALFVEQFLLKLLAEPTLGQVLVVVVHGSTMTYGQLDGRDDLDR